MFKIKIILFLLPFSVVSQNVTGKVYDSEATAKGIQVINTTQKIKTFTNENGDFTIKAAINDSLTFKSLFHHETSIKISDKHFKEQFVVELVKKVNALGEVLLSDSIKPKVFDPIDYTQELSMGIAEDIKKNPYKYRPEASFGGANHFFLIQELFSLFNKNREKKQKEALAKTINYATFDSLFSNDTFFNKALLRNDLKINDTLKPLFFDYCDTQQLNPVLLNKQNQIILLDSLMHCSNRFQKIITDHKKE